MPTTPERRKHTRVLLKTRIVFKPVDSEKEFSTDYSENLSTNGIFIVTDSNFEIGTMLELHFSLPNYKKIIKVNGKVVWKSTTQRAGKEFAGLGIEFQKIDAESKQIIADYIERTSS
ncbi:MAG: hypothetical protein A3F16_03695 [Deltaproteobacteria bacterium RIFCSPHIGHO2_12_FULL_43_9]|nr:MAG: hypothetical protein A3F16_03695 [Deltaproteobacteria bacterium RIFCSPHIGHO2_12_FULL_43_9]